MRRLDAALTNDPLFIFDVAENAPGARMKSALFLDGFAVKLAPGTGAIQGAFPTNAIRYFTLRTLSPPGN